jgi:hypothetical protein
MKQPTHAGTHDAATHQQSPRREVARLTRAGLVLTLEGAAALALITTIRAAPAAPADAEPATLGTETVATRPERVRSRTVEIEGTVGFRPTRITEQDRGTFVLLGKRRTRLLVVPRDRARLAAFRAGTPVVVRGTVIVPPNSARLARRPTSRTAIAERAGSTAIVKATHVGLLR